MAFLPIFSLNSRHLQDIKTTAKFSVSGYCGLNKWCYIEL